MKTFSIKAKQINKRWYLINAENAIPGRLAAFVANQLRGKHKPEFTPSMDCGDNIIIINADKVKFTGNKLYGKIYYRHTGYPGGIKSKTARDILNGKNPHEVLQKSIQNMMPGGPLSRKQLKNLFVYSGEEHPHQAQKPQNIDIQKLNPKNINRQEISK